MLCDDCGLAWLLRDLTLYEYGRFAINAFGRGALKEELLVFSLDI